MTTHAYDCECDAYACTLRRKAVIVSPKAMPSRHNRVPPRRTVPPGQPLVYQDRPGGFKMPIFNPDGSHLRRKQYLERKYEVDSKLARIQAGPPKP